MTHLFASENQCASIFHEYFPDFDKSSGANSGKCEVWCSCDVNLRLDTGENARNVTRIQNKKLTSLEKNARHRKKSCSIPIQSKYYVQETFPLRRNSSFVCRYNTRTHTEHSAWFASYCAKEFGFSFLLLFMQNYYKYLTPSFLTQCKRMMQESLFLVK